MILTVEEISMIHSVHHDSRREALFDIVSELPMIKDKELKRLCKGTEEKLKSMSDADFDGMNFTIDWEE